MTGKRSTKAVKKRHDRNILTFYEKLAVIRYSDEQNMSRNSLARMFQCCATQIRKILEKKEELLLQLATLSDAGASIIIEEMTRKRRKFEMSAIGFILYQWVERCRSLRLCKSITNDTLKETALKMAAILNLPAFRPTYRWLNRFRSKYKYKEQDLGLTEPANGSIGELAVEDIIIEFKGSLPNFMQKEISAITSSMHHHDTSLLAMHHSSIDAEVKEKIPSPLGCSFEATEGNTNSMPSEDNADLHNNPAFDNVLQQLASIERFAMLNTDQRALELVAQLSEHLKSCAAAGDYSVVADEYSVSSAGEVDLFGEQPRYGEIDDIVLIE